MSFGKPEPHNLLAGLLKAESREPDQELDRLAHEVIGAATGERAWHARAHANRAFAEERLAEVDDVRSELLEGALRILAAPAVLRFVGDHERLMSFDEEQVALATAAGLEAVRPQR